MDLKSGTPYFLLKNGLGPQYDILKSDCSAEFLILGGGISGALMAHALVESGMPCVLIDKRPLGLGSTSASTSLLQYEIDVPLHQLVEKIGRENAIASYKLCGEAIDKIKLICEKVGFDHFQPCESLYFLHHSGDPAYMEREYAIRKEAGFDVRLLAEKEIVDRYGFESKAAILSRQAAKVDVYKLTHMLHAYNQKKGCRIFENTEVGQILESETGVELITDKHFRINAKKVIYATGYEVTEQLSKSIVELKSTFTFITERMGTLPDFFDHTLLWNTADPYLYIREADNRLIIGGRDEDYYAPEKRASHLEKKVRQLEADFLKLFPQLPIKKEFSWAGTFGETKDGLPYIGTYSEKPNSYFALGFGGNGITFSALAADFIVETIKRGKNAVPEMFRFGR